MRYRLATILVVAALLGGCGKARKPQTDSPTDAAPETPKPEVTALLQFWDKSLNEHVYTYGDGQPAEYRRNPNFTNERVVGYVAIKPIRNTVRLYRAYARDQKHYFYVSESPPGADKHIERIEAFVVYVWDHPGDGRVPVHACFLPDHKDAYFDRDLTKVKDYVDGTLKGIGQQRRLAENYFYVYPTGPAPGKAPPPVTPTPPTAPTAQPDWVVGLWMGKAGSNLVLLYYGRDGFFKEYPTGSSTDGIVGVYKAQAGAGGRVEIRRDVGGTITPEFNGPNTMTHPIGPSGTRVVLSKSGADDDPSPLKQPTLSPGGEALRKGMVGKWKTRDPVAGKGGNEAHAVEYRVDGSFTYTIAAASRPARTVNGRWVATGEERDKQGRTYTLSIVYYIEGRPRPFFYVTVHGTSISQPALDGGEVSSAFYREP